MWKSEAWQNEPWNSGLLFPIYNCPIQTLLFISILSLWLVLWRLNKLEDVIVLRYLNSDGMGNQLVTRGFRSARETGTANIPEAWPPSAWAYGRQKQHLEKLKRANLKMVPGRQFQNVEGPFTTLILSIYDIFYFFSCPSLPRTLSISCFVGLTSFCSFKAYLKYGLLSVALLDDSTF